MFQPVCYRSCRLFFLLLFAAMIAGAQPVGTDSFTLHFAFDGYRVSHADSQALRHFIDAGERAIDSLVVTGHTDTFGSVVYNERLSLRRAGAVAALLQQWNLPPLRVEGRGEKEPVPGDDSASRRVSVLVYRHPAPPPPVEVKADTPRSVSEPDTVIRLDDIRFVANTATPTDVTQTLLPKYISQLLGLKDRYLEIDGYCNSPGAPLAPTDVLFILSVQRAKFVYDCLVEKGFDSTRLRYVGRGNANPRIEHPATREEMDKNMRVEVKVFRKKPE